MSTYVIVILIYYRQKPMKSKLFCAETELLNL
jgi:hypothetical protein